MRRALFCLIITAVPLVGACSTSDSGAATCDTPTQTTTVDIENMSFSTPCVAATSNDTLSVVNHDQAAHTYTVKGTSINVSVDPGQTAQAELTGVAPGTYSVICTYHPSMTASLRVS
jgi:plastocyanin